MKKLSTLSPNNCIIFLKYMTDPVLKARLDILPELILELQTAIRGNTNNGLTVEYRMDTGQSTTKVVRVNLKTANDTLASYYNEYMNLQQLCGITSASVFLR